MKTNKKIYLLLIGIVVVLIAGIILFSILNQPADNLVPESTASTAALTSVKIPSLFTEEESISCDVIQDGLRDIGKLVTEEYYFTEMADYSNEKKFLDISLPFTQSEYMISYDGTISAGVDFTKIAVDKDEVQKKIIISIPASEILSTEIDPESFRLYSEKEGLWNSISVEDYNTSLSELTNTAQSKALSRGLLEKADLNAKSVIQNFVQSLLGSEGYTVEFVDV